MSKYRKEVIKPGDKASRLAHEICIESYGNCMAVVVIPHQPGNFRGAVDFNWSKEVLEAMVRGEVNMTWQNDGAGGKPQFFTLVGTKGAFYGLGWEILVMCIDDIVRSGAFPAIMSNELCIKGVTEENYPLVDALFRGYGDALAKCRLINITGETAIMKHSITAFCDFHQKNQLVVTWGGACLGLTRRDKLIDGSKIRPGMPIVGFWEPGYRCNGGTVFTNIILARTGGDLSRLKRDKELMDFVTKLTIPSTSYARLICEAHGWLKNGMAIEPLVKMAGIAHITGGGVWEKLGDLLPAGCGANLDSMPAPPSVLLEAQALSWDLPDLRIADLDAYGDLHGACGALVIPEDEAEMKKLIGLAFKHEVMAYHVGTVTASEDGEITIDSRFREGRRLSSKELEQ